MTKPRGSVEFLAEFPDDTVYDAAGDEVQFAGANVARAIGALLTKQGYEVAAPENCQELGWEFDVRRDRSRFWLRLTKIQEFVLVTQDMTFRLWPKPGPYVQFLQDLHAQLAGDPRFSRIRWFQDVLPADGGAWFPAPVDAP
ncbi:MAG: hypothetical protein ACK41C_00330 [Phenylobacterium sp.]|uniref:hypothetical protein n=1 Tax=Phenylobacterium sp. TaxID=1871053 RepID=UPI00391BF4FC